MEEPLCRTCLVETDGSIFKTIFLADRELSLGEMFNECTGLKLTASDGISLNICDICTEEIIKFYVFRVKCWDSHKFLLRRLKDSTLAIDSSKSEAASNPEVLDDAAPLLLDINVNEPDDSVPEQTEPSDSVVPEKAEPSDSVAVKCELCDKIYPCRIALLRHLHKVHKTFYYRKLECKYCKKTYSSTCTLRKHIRCIHEKPDTDDKDTAKFICQYCGLNFKNRVSVTLHVRRHTGEKPYKCDLCEYRATQFTSMRNHMRTHTGEKPYECSDCGKLFRTSSARASHRRSHSDETPYECRVCFKKFKKRDIYKEHMIIHNPDKYIECKYCGKKFARKDNLNTHIKQHTGEKPHVCEHCGKGFIRKHSWQTHMKNNHNE